MTPYYSDDHVTLYHARWEDVPPDLLRADVLVTDPPYGMAWDVDTTRFSGGSPDSRKRRGKGNATRMPVLGDSEPFDPSPWLGYRDVVLFGLNHFPDRLPPGSALVWLKKNEGAFGTFLGDAEIAWQKGGRGVYCFSDLSMWGIERNRDHPTQKPVGLMRWVITRCPDGTILDPYAGSGTTLVAAKSLGRKSIGVECVERYCEVAANRLRQEVLGLTA